MMLKAPRLFAKYGGHLGASGLARMEFACNRSSRTAISRLETKSPLLVQRALYPDMNLPNMAHVYLMSSAGGVLQGDRLEIGIEAEENTMARITTQSATKIYRMDKGYAFQRVNISAAAGSYIEFVPRQLIPFRSSRFCQDVAIQASPDSVVLYSETVSAGRTASGEHFDFDVCFLRFRAFSSANRLLFSDACRIEPGLDKKETFDRLFGGKAIWSTIYIIAPSAEEAGVEKEILKAIQESSILAGTTSLPNDSGLLVRMLDNSIDRVDAMLSIITQITRNHMTRSVTNRR